MTDDESRLITDEALARTYDGGYYTDAYAVVEQYHEIMSYASRHPDMGSSAISSRFEDIPRSRIRTWTDDGGTPDPIRCIDTAREYGWLYTTPGDDVFRGLNGLVANVFSGGVIDSSTYRPSFALNERGTRASVFDALELVGVDYRVEERDDRADEVFPTDDGTVLGRVLSVLGAPVGAKTQQHLELPDYLEDAPAETRRTFVEHYLENRATRHEGKDTLTIQEEDRPRSYLEDLCALIRDVSGGEVTASDMRVTISADAARRLEGV
ncbi:hypothetical protein ACYJ1Y_14355 [Natrialbaceae archaeon A-gly3]